MSFTGHDALQDWLAETLGARSVEITGSHLLSGGAIQENWHLDCLVGGFEQSFVLRRDAAAAVAASHSRADEFAVLQAAFAAGVQVPRPLGVCTDESVIGGPFMLVEQVGGIGYGPKLVRDTTFGGDREALGEDLGRQLARIHAIAPDETLTRILGPRPDDAVAADIAWLRGAMDDLDVGRLDLELALRIAERHAPDISEIVVSHRDFRTGNIMVDETGLTAILDWEFVSWAEPMTDIGWFCAKCWRFSRPDLEAGGLASRDAFYHGYEAESGRKIDASRVAFWEMMAHIRWAVIALQQGARHASGQEPSLHLALTGRIADELGFDALKLALAIGQEQSGSVRNTQHLTHETQASNSVMNDAHALLSAAESVLRDEIAPHAKGDLRYKALLSANAVAMAAREQVLTDTVDQARVTGVTVADIRTGQHDGDERLAASILHEAAIRAWVASPRALSEAERVAHLPQESGGTGSK
jgi:aminoglycoside phosphotransferase (APT) family kinase protein